MLNKIIKFRIQIVFLLLFFNTTINAQPRENDPPPGFELGEQLDQVRVDPYVSSDSYFDFAWDINWFNYNNSSMYSHDNPFEQQYNIWIGNNNTGSGGGINIDGLNRQQFTIIALTRTVKPGETHTQAVKVIRDPSHSTYRFVSNLVVNGIVVGRIIFSDSLRDANGVYIYTKMTVEVFNNSPVAITSLVPQETEYSKYEGSQHSTDFNLQNITADMKLYNDLGIISFNMPMNEGEDLIITGNTTTASSSTASKKDPCLVAKELTTLATDPAYKKAVQDIRNTPDFYDNEHCIALGKNASGQTIAGEMKQGDNMKVQLDHSIQGFFTYAHNHPGYGIHSGIDLNNITVLTKLYPNYAAGLVIPSKEEAYMAVVTDLAAAQLFVAKYCTNPKTNEPDHYPDFMRKEMSEVFGTMKSYSIESESRAKAFVFSKYNVGITFFRQNNNGTFYPLLLKETKQANGSKTYILIPCG